ncbi:XisI protein [Candidatus Parabeggiatoa sp. HSG14]|uniref:XisI protein n=1 Tax=Candidatus Parabeggiatoa sp. HSG14 TaxID=3055593 RepID=UPI0025A80082|nr:XisI protein [Thiotrichales bacterium HSG14]
MESTITFYQQCIKTILAHYESLRTEETNIELIYDDERMHYMVLRVGWVSQKRMYLCLLHMDIVDETIIIQCNNTEDRVASELVQMGIPKEHIGLGFIPPETCSDAEFKARMRF